MRRNVLVESTSLVARVAPAGRLFWKFFAACWLALLAASALVGGLLWIDAQALRPRTHSIDAGPLGRLLVDAAAEVGRSGGRAALTRWLTNSASDGDRPRPPVYAIDGQGRDLLDRPVPAAAITEARAAAAGDDANPPSALRQIVLDGEPLLLFVPAPAERPPPGPGPAPLDRPPGPASDPPGGPRPPPWLVPLAVGGIASLLLSALLAWYFARPIRALDAAFRRAGEGDLAVRVAPLIGRRRDEVADLGHGFDRMVQRIDDLLQSQRRLLHDVSHELRSPLARLQVCVALARRDPAQAARMLDRIERETERMDELVEEILTLARLESGAAVDDDSREPTELAALLAASVDDARIEGEQRGIAVQLGVVQEARLIGRAALLQRAIDNVMRNAIKYASPGSAVEVTLQVDAGRNAILQVVDRGPGLSAEERSAIFEPFVRGRVRGGDGFGLGLAIAQRAVQAHGGCIEARPREGGGLVMTITLPGVTATGA